MGLELLEVAMRMWQRTILTSLENEPGISKTETHVNLGKILFRTLLRQLVTLYKQIVLNEVDFSVFLEYNRLEAESWNREMDVRDIQGPFDKHL